MTPISLAGSGAIITVIEFALRYTNVDLPDGSVAALVNGVVTVGGIVLLIWGQLRRKDLKYGLFRIQ